jgi:hypothetical protein
MIRVQVRQGRISDSIPSRDNNSFVMLSFQGGSYSKGDRESFTDNKAATVWSWPLISIYSRG